MSSLRTSVRRLVPPSTLTSAPHMHSTPSLLPLVPPFIVQSVRCFASPTLPRASSSQAPRSSGSAVASLGLPTGFPALQPKQVNEKTPMEYIAEVPPKEVDGSTAVCEGGGGAMGHPVEYIQLNKVHPGEPSTCLYCGLRFVRKTHH